MAEEIIAKLKIDASELQGALGKIKGNAPGTSVMSKATKSTNTMSLGSAAKIGAVMGAVSAGVNILIGVMKKGFAKMEEASPMLRGTIKIFNQSLLLMFKPIGDMLAMFLRPMALAFLRYAVTFYKKWHDIKSFFSKDKSKTEDITKVVNGNPQGSENLRTGLTTPDTSSFGGFLKGIQAVVDAFSVLNAVWDIITGAVRVVISALYLLGSVLVKVNEAWLGPLIPVFNLLSDVILTLAQVFSDAMKPIQDWITGVISFKQMMSKLNPIAKKLWSNLGIAWGNFLKSMRASWDSVKDKFTKITDKLKDWGNTFFDIVMWPFKQIGNTIQHIVNKIVDTWNSLPHFLSGGKSDKSKEDFNYGNDFVVSPSGKMIKTNPRDYIFATTNPKSMIGQSMSYSPNITINANVNNQIDIQRLAEDIANYSKNELTRRTNNFRI